MTSQPLAIKGGTPVIAKGRFTPQWPEITEDDLKAVSQVIAAHDLTSLTRDGAVSRLEQRWAAEVGTEHCVAVANGTDALTIALAAAGVGPGDEVIVPALSFMASAMAPMHLGALPIFVDIDRDSYNIDTTKIEEKISARTRAIMPVHLHGLPADLDPIIALARRHGLVVIEDAAQCHGGRYRNRPVGALGSLGTFSLNVSKNLPTCGEGGLITTNDGELARAARRYRQFGETLIPGERRTYLHHHLGWNAKMSAPQAAFADSQLDRFHDYMARREHNVRSFLTRLSLLPGLIAPDHPEDRSHVWHILRFRVDPVAAGVGQINPGAFRKAIERALQAEGAPVSDYQRAPLPAQPVFQNPGPLLKGKYGLTPERLKQEYGLHQYPRTCEVIATSFTLQKVHLPPDAADHLMRIADAFEKVFSHLDDIVRLASVSKYHEPWTETLASAPLN